MKKRYVCFMCYRFHPEMKGVSEEEFQSGKNICTEEKCIRKGKLLEPAYVCDTCDRLYPVDENHTHAT